MKKAIGIAAILLLSLGLSAQTSAYDLENRSLIDDTEDVQFNGLLSENAEDYSYDEATLKDGPAQFAAMPEHQARKPKRQDNPK